MLEIDRNLAIPEGEITMTYMTSQGAGGQNVNRVATAVRLRFDVARSSLPREVKDRLLALRDRRITKRGVVVIRAQRYRHREKNRSDALRRLAALIRRAMITPARRKKTSPTGTARKKRLEEKKRRGEVKSLRRKIPLGDPR